MLLEHAIPPASELEQALSAEHPIKALHQWIQQGTQTMDDAFRAGAPVEELVHCRGKMIDALMQVLWREHFENSDHPIGLVAVGGYGRGELHPHSDVDIMLLIGSEDTRHYGGQIETFITLLWDLGLDIGHSVRSLSDVEREAKSDVTVLTNMMEARHLAGDPSLFDQMQAIVSEESLWPIQDFYRAKLSEQESRYKKFDNDAYKLEPNIKDGPGGLRDIQNINWVAKRFYNVGTLSEITELGFLSEQETEQLLEGRALLWRIRWGLHSLAERGENRLRFDLQRQLATLFGYEDEPEQPNAAVESFMQDYYRTVIRLERLNEMLLQLLREAIFPVENPSLDTINERFHIRNGYLEVSSADVFEKNPSALLEVFQHMQQRHELDGIGAQTIRLIRAHRDDIDDDFRNDPVNQQIFLDLLKQPVGVTREFRRMNRYGILARYLPEFGHLVGRMQFDLFHIYTVDQHTIAVLGFARIFTVDEGRKNFPNQSEIYDRLEKPELLHIAALFHDIGKGHGGDHSKIGADMVADFCRRHGMSRADTQLIVWLVRHHLIMSLTAQRKDISDTQEIQNFAEFVGNQRCLDYLYLLTIADTNGTNPSLWTSWKERLLYELYNRTTRYLRRGMAQGLDAEEIAHERQEKALDRLEYSDHSHAAIRQLWEELPTDYFLRHSSDEIAWHTQVILKTPEDKLPLVAIKERARRGGTPVFIYGHERDDFFAHAVITFARIGLSIVDARILSSKDGRALDTFMVLEPDNSPVESPERREQITKAMHSALLNPAHVTEIPKQRIPNKLKHFDVKTRIHINSTSDNRFTVVEVMTADRPGLLARIGQAFIETDTRLHNAKINTIGEQVDDIFFVTDDDNQPLSDPNVIEHFTQRLQHWIDDAQE
ncbi:protein-P-II uridylyltransferase [gamma proteobacterium HTCC5015]|nr:protein-P-II uridylyltransferase [gamma proteobacterium HTCC5015]